MQEMVKVAVDAMGGDNAPGELVKGAVDAVTMRKEIKVFLVGQEAVVREELAKYTYPEDGAAGDGNPEEEAVIHCDWYEYG